MFMFVICLHEIKVNNFDNFGNALEQLNISKDQNNRNKHSNGFIFDNMLDKSTCT